MVQPRRPRVLVADDYSGMVTALERLLAMDCEVVGSVADGAALLETAERLRPDVILLDLNMPNVNSLDACRQITDTMPRTKVIVLTAVNDPVVRHRALAAGASAYVLKQAIADDLLLAIRNATADPPQ